MEKKENEYKQQLIARYTFDDRKNVGKDSSGHGKFLVKNKYGPI